MDFVAIDVETANPDMSSICQIGIAHYSNQILVDEWVTLIDPEDYFDFICIDIHGIDEDTIEGAPKLPEVASIIASYLKNNLVICHTHFDRTAINRAFSKYDLEPIDANWLDSARVARRAWPEFAWRGYGLKNVCNKIGYEFKHHDALEDAKAAGAVMLEAARITGLDLDEWQKRIRQPIDPNNSSEGSAIKREGNPEGDLFGEVIVFTGSLNMPRKEAANLAAAVGCNVGQNVTKKTTMLVVGDQDVMKLAGNNKSSKHRKAELLIKEGQAIKLIKESDFDELVRGIQAS